MKLCFLTCLFGSLYAHVFCLGWIWWYDGRVCDEAWLDVWLGFMLWWMPWMLGYAMIDVWLGMFDAMLIIRCMFVCVCVCVCVCQLDTSIEFAFNRVKT